MPITKSIVFYMVSKQIGIVVRNFHNKKYYKSIHEILHIKILELIDKYEITVEDIDDLTFCRVNLMYRKINLSSDLLKTDFNNLKNSNILKDLNIKIIKKGEINKSINTKYLPLTTNTNKFGNLLIGNLKEKYLNKLKQTISYNKLEKPILLEKVNYNLLEVYIKKVKGTGTKNTRLNYYIILITRKDLINNYVIFDRNTGICLYEAKDIIEVNYFIRVIGNISLKIKNNNIIQISKNIKLESLQLNNYKSKRIVEYSPRSNPNFGVLDLETYEDVDGSSKIYAIGYVTLLEKIKINTFYLTDLVPSLDSNLLLILCIDSMLITKYHNYNFYIHNMGNYDIIYIYKILCEYNLNKKEEYYKLKTIYKDNIILKLSISIKTSTKKTIKINLIDSLNLLNASLDVLSEDFNLSTKKSIFPYKFVTKDKLNYIGETPGIEYYNISFKQKITELEYKEMYTKNNWDLRKETITYLEKDLISLLEVLEKFNSSLFINHNIQMTECLTISRIALTKFLKNYLEDKKIPLINKLQYFNFINYGYYGGITSVYIPYGTNLNYYDVNSLYPFVALQVMPGIECNYIETIEDKGLELKDLFGFFYAEVKTNYNLYLGLLPIKTKWGLTFPNGNFEGIWSSEELKFAQENGYEIKVIKGYNFNKVENVFTKYVTEIYELKSKTKGVEKAINKSLLNNLLGRFGMNIIKPITKNVKKEELDYILSTREVNLNFDSFKKREKIYNKDNIWIDTKPLLYNNIEKNIIKYSKNNTSISKIF